MASKHKEITAVIGDEFNDPLLTRLIAALKQLGAMQLESPTRALAGSQDIERYAVSIDGRRLDVEAETYIGISVRGPEDLVEQVKNS